MADFQHWVDKADAIPYIVPESRWGKLCFVMATSTIFTYFMYVMTCLNIGETVADWVLRTDTTDTASNVSSLNNATGSTTGAPTVIWMSNDSTLVFTSTEWTTTPKPLDLAPIFLFTNIAFAVIYTVEAAIKVRLSIFSILKHV